MRGLMYLMSGSYEIMNLKHCCAYVLAIPKFIVGMHGWDGPMEGNH